jgi:beta-lactamase superfamily II metal-dependent hydrolase
MLNPSNELRTSGAILSAKKARWGNPPEDDELEVCIFGPGIGEAILVHIGAGRWICVDSARCDGEPWPVHYLQSLSIPPTQIFLVVATHWHSDHVDGLGEIVQKCPGAQFVCSNALRVDEFKNLLARYVELETERVRAPLLEIRSIIRAYGERRKADRNHPAPIFTSAKTLLHRVDVAGVGVLEVWSLSPSADDVLTAQSEFANLFIPLDEYATGISAIRQNSSCVVLVIKAGADAILLGSDLERTTSNLTGWNAVVNGGWPLVPVNAIKISHHGSAGSFSQALWDNFVQPGAIAVVTPYTPSGLPRIAELDRLRAMGCELYVTALPQEVPVERSVDVRREISGMTKSFRSFSLDGKNGVVRLRKKIGSTDRWVVETFDSAQRY